MKVGIFGYIGDPDSPVAAMNFGIGECGDEVELFLPETFNPPNVPQDIDAAIVFSMGIMGGPIRNYYHDRIPVFIVEQGHTDRMLQHTNGSNWRRGFYQLSIDQLNWLPDTAPDDRRKALGIEYRNAVMGKRDGYILMIGQKPGDAQHFGVDVMHVMEGAIKAIRGVTDREIVYRTHPKDGTLKLPEGEYTLQYASATPLANSFDGAHSVVTFNSNAGLYSVMRGIPTYCNPRAIYAPMCSSKLEDIEHGYRADPEKWIDCMNRICYAQWTESELGTGAPWRYIKEKAFGETVLA